MLKYSELLHQVHTILGVERCPPPPQQASKLQSEIFASLDNVSQTVQWLSLPRSSALTSLVAQINEYVNKVGKEYKLLNMGYPFQCQVCLTCSFNCGNIFQTLLETLLSLGPDSIFLDVKETGIYLLR